MTNKVPDPTDGEPLRKDDPDRKTKQPKQVPHNPVEPMKMDANAPDVNHKSQTSRMSTIQKVKLMSDLANAADQKELLDQIRQLPSGDKIADLFIEAVENKLSEMMYGEQEKEAAASNIVETMQRLSSLVVEMREMLSSFMNTPLIGTLNQLNQKLGGLPLSGNQPVQQQPQQPVNPAQNSQFAHHSHYQTQDPADQQDRTNRRERGEYTIL